MADHSEVYSGVVVTSKAKQIALDVLQEMLRYYSTKHREALKREDETWIYNHAHSRKAVEGVMRQLRDFVITDE